MTDTGSNVPGVISRLRDTTARVIGPRITFTRGISIPDSVIVVAFDMCSSTDILEELILRGDAERYVSLIAQLKHFLVDAQKFILFEPYKFMGDGWILLFMPDADGASLWEFVTDISAFYEARFKADLLPHLNTRPTTTGLTFGVDVGDVAPLMILQQPEYVGRPITIACRLQSEVRSVTKKPGHKALVSSAVFSKHLANVPTIRARTKRVSLHNIRGGRDFACKLIRTC